jgi:DNA ligase (NAD+)
LEKLKKAKKENLENIDGIGEVVADKIISFFANEKNKILIDNLLQEIKVKSHKTQTEQNHYFSGKKILITGSFENFSRDKLKEVIRVKGGKNVSSISAQTDILLAGKKAGSKLKKAKNFGTEILEEKMILKFIE